MFLSRQLKPTEQRYSAYEREPAVVAYYLQSWRHYLGGCPGGVTVVTDHQPLVSLMDEQVLTRVPTRWLRLGLFQSIRPTIKYQPGKANVVADALSRSQKKETEGSVDDPMATEAAIEAHVSALSGISVELTAEDLQTWAKAYKEDKSHVVAYTKLRHGQKNQDVYLTPFGLMARMVGGQQKIIVPRSLRQNILKECHDVPFIGHMGMRKTLELVDRQFHWRGLRGDTIQEGKGRTPIFSECKSAHDY